jgi:pilus assembly protein Flp/PilA
MHFHALNLYIRLQTLMLEEDGQDLIEYSLVIALIAFGAAASMSALASGISAEFSKIDSIFVAHP